MEFVTQKEQLTRIDAHQSAQNRSQTITSSASIKALMNILTELLVPMWRKETYLLFISHFARRLGIHQKKDANEHLFFLHKIFFRGKKDDIFRAMRNELLFWLVDGELKIFLKFWLPEDNGKLKTTLACGQCWLVRSSRIAVAISVLTIESTTLTRAFHSNILHSIWPFNTYLESLTSLSTLWLGTRTIRISIWFLIHYSS